MSRVISPCPRCGRRTRKKHGVIVGHNSKGPIWEKVCWKCCGRNGTLIENEKNKCLDCGQEISRNSFRCKPCSYKHNWKTHLKNNPLWARGRERQFEDEDLIYWHKKGYTDHQIAEQLKFSYSAIATRRRSLGLSPNSIKPEKKQYFCECGKEISKGSKRCKDCSNKHLSELWAEKRKDKKPKKEKPKKEKLTADIKKYRKNYWDKNREKYVYSQGKVCKSCGKRLRNEAITEFCFKCLCVEKKRLNKEKEKDLLEQLKILNTKGLSDKEIASKFSMSLKQIQKRRRSMELRAVYKFEKRAQIKVPNFDKRLIEFKQSGKTDREIAVIFGVGKTTIGRRRRELKLPGIENWGKGFRKSKLIEVMP